MTDNAYEKAYQREKSARNEAEHLLEDLSRKLYEKNEEIKSALRRPKTQPIDYGAA